jgi:hypothetical protein
MTQEEYDQYLKSELERVSKPHRPPPFHPIKDLRAAHQAWKEAMEEDKRSGTPSEGPRPR